jgi:hypothetical protein
MKIAIIGQGPIALYAAAHFYELGAHVVLFKQNQFGGNINFLKKFDPEMLVDYPTGKTVASFYEDDLVPLIKLVEENQLVKTARVLRVHKRFLRKNEVLKNRSRMADLFRVVYAVNPADSILKQVAENPEMFQKLGVDVLNSLQQEVEAYEDFDAVIEARGLGKMAMAMGPSGVHAINELNLKMNSPFYYGREFFEKFITNNDLVLKTKHLVIVGNSKNVEFTFKKCIEFISSKNLQITWVTSEKVDRSKKAIDEMISMSDQEFLSDKIKYENDLRNYRDLMDYEKAKVSPPNLPLERLKIYDGFEVTSVDKLLDREGLFITIESPDFRELSENDGLLKTISCDAVGIFNGVDELHLLGRELAQLEPGYYSIHSNGLKEGLNQIRAIEEKLMTFFSKGDH